MLMCYRMETNAYLAQANICFCHPSINPKDRNFRRVLNNGSLEQEGRLGGGFWQRMTSEERTEHIRINQDAEVECDYGQMNLLLLYADADTEDAYLQGTFTT